MNSLRLSLFFLLSLTLLACNSSSSSSGLGAGGKADDTAEACASCELNLDACMNEAEDGADVNACLAGFALCYAETTSQAIPCPEGEDCSECIETCTDEECLAEQGECILVALDFSAAARCPALEAPLSCDECEENLVSCLSDSPGDLENCTETFSQCLGTAALAGTCGDELNCDFCELGLKQCEDNAQDGAELNACLVAFSACYVEAKGQAIECPEGEDCSHCEADCGADDLQCLNDKSSCIVVGLDLHTAAQCEPVPLCSSCESELEACLDGGQDEDFCLGGFSSCYVDATQSALECPAGEDCSICDEIECGPNPVSGCLKRQSFCIAVQSGHGEAAVCPQ